MRFGVCLFLLLSLTVPSRSKAGLIVVSDDRFVSNPSDGISRPDAGASAFDASAVGPTGSASQHSSLGPSSFTASGDVTIQSGGVGGDSVFDVEFTVDAPMEFTLAGLIDATEDANTAFLGDSTGTIHTFAHNLSLNGFFEPGTTYRLFVGIQTAAGNTQTSGSYDFSLLPEPGTALFAGLTLLLLCFRFTSESLSPK
jgi:hypothetical protein